MAFLPARGAAIVAPNGHENITKSYGLQWLGGFALYAAERAGHRVGRGPLRRAPQDWRRQGADDGTLQQGGVARAGAGKRGGAQALRCGAAQAQDGPLHEPRGDGRAATPPRRCQVPAWSSKLKLRIMAQTLRVSAIVRVMLGPERASAIQIFAGDVVPKKKPDPAIYQLAAETLGVSPARCCVVEDSHIGVTAAKAAGMTCIVTKSGYTADEDFSAADAVYECIGDSPADGFSLATLAELLSAAKLPA
eukprot:SM000368S13750  [mRNA]  locus=s368:19914:22027:- [translate_table: standard]